MANNPLDAGKSPEQLLAERTQRLEDAMQLKQPDRIPINMPASYLLSEYGGITHREQQDNYQKAQDLLEKFALEFEPDSVMGLFNSPRPSLILGDTMTKWPGYGLPDTGSFQFIEHEYMKGEDYDAYLRDPSDWTIRTYLPRAFTELEGLKFLGPLSLWGYGHYNLPSLPGLTIPPVQAALQALSKAIDEGVKDAANAADSLQRMINLGFPPPPLNGTFSLAPFDFMSDAMRGMRGIMLDILRRPDKLLAAERVALESQLEASIGLSRATGLVNCFIPLHRGSDGFMSMTQFEKFYWPQLKELMVRLVEAGQRPVVFYEGVWDQRLKYLCELPKGKTVGFFQLSDIFKVKDVVGDTMCIMGGMKNSLLAAGTPQQVRDWTRQLCEKVGKGGGYIMCTGVGEMEGSKLENVRAWVDATREFGVY